MVDVDLKAFRTFAVDPPYMARTLHAMLLKRQQELIDSLRYANEWSDFKRRVGVIEGLSEAIGICHEMVREEQS